MVLAELIGVFVIALSILYLYHKCVIFNFWHKRGVFYVEPVVPTGNIRDIITGKVQLGVLFQNAYMKYKDHRAFGMYSLFKPNLVIADLDLIRTVLTKEFGSFHDHGMYYNDNADPLSSHLFLTPGKKWRNMRVKMTPTFTSGKMRKFFAILKECGDELAKYMESKAQMRDSVEIKDMFARYTTDTIMSVAFGIKSNCIEEPNNEYRTYEKKIFEMNPIWVASFVLVPQVMDFFSIPLTDRSFTKFYTNIFRENVEYRKSHNIVKHDFMDLLIQLMEKGYVEPDDDKATNESPTVNKLTMMEATAQSYIFFIAGYETSSTTGTFALYELAQNHDIQDKVYKEINEMLTKHGDLTYDSLNEMTYLHKVVNGTSVTIPVLGLHRDPSIYPDPDTFDPERFNADVVAERHPYAFLPFGEGPRICIGLRFGYMQIKVGLVNLLSKYKFILHPRTQVPLSFDEKFSVLATKSGVHLIIEPR